MSSKKRAGAMDALENFGKEAPVISMTKPKEQGRRENPQPPSVAPASPHVKEEKLIRPAKSVGRPKRDYPEGTNIITTSTYIPEPAHDKLREYVFLHKGTSINDCLLEGLDLFFKKNGIHPIHQLLLSSRG